MSAESTQPTSTLSYNLVIKKRWFGKHKEENGNYVATGNKKIELKSTSRTKGLFRRKKTVATETTTPSSLDTLDLKDLKTTLTRLENGPSNTKITLPDGLLESIDDLISRQNATQSDSIAQYKYAADRANILVEAHTHAASYQSEWLKHFETQSLKKEVPEDSKTAFRELAKVAKNSLTEAQGGVERNSNKRLEMLTQIHLQSHVSGEAPPPYEVAPPPYEEAPPPYEEAPPPRPPKTVTPPPRPGKSASVKEIQAQIVTERTAKQALIIDPNRPEKDNRNIPQEFKKQHDIPEEISQGNTEIKTRLTKEPVNITEQTNHFSEEHIKQAELDALRLLKPAHSITEPIADRSELLARRLQESLTAKFEYDKPNIENPEWRKEAKQEIHEHQDTIKQKITSQDSNYSGHHALLDQLHQVDLGNVEQIRGNLRKLFTMQKMLDNENKTQADKQELQNLQTKHQKVLDTHLQHGKKSASR